MGTETIAIIILGHKFQDKTSFDDVPDEDQIWNFDTYRKQNMDGNLKLLIGEEYTILGLPLSITYLDEGETLDLYTVNSKELELQKYHVLNMIEKSPYIGNEEPNVQLHILMHVT